MNESGINFKKIAIEFLKLAASGKSDEAFEMYVGSGFKHHNAYFKGDAQSLMEAMKENALENPNKVLEIKHSILEDNLVVVHSHIRQKTGDLGAAVVHIFRFQDNKIAELWDLGQPVPEKCANENGMF